MTLLSFLALSFILRICGLASSNLWGDEFITFGRASQPLVQYLSGPVKYYEFIGINMWEMFLRLWIWGPHWVMRLPAFACAMLSLWLAWRIMDEMNFVQRERTISAVIMACLPGLLWMAQDARYYAPLAALYMASMLCALRGNWRLIIVCIVLSFLVHPTGPAYTVSALGIALVAKSMDWRKVIISGAISGAVWLIYILFITTLDTSAPFWWVGDFTLTSFVYEYGQSLTVNVLGHPGILIAFLFTYVIFLAGLLRRDWLPWLIWALPMAIIMLVSLTYKNVITYRTLQPAAIGLALLAGRVLAAYRWTWVPAGILLVAMLLNWDPSTRSGDLVAIAERIRYEWREGDCIEYSKLSGEVSLLLEDLPECGASTALSANGRRWLVTPFDCAQGELVDRSASAWQTSPVNVYLVNK